MAATKKPTVAKEFQDMIQGDRQRKKNEALAQQIFGKGNRRNVPAAGNNGRKAGTGLSLADRITSSKRSSSVTLNPTSFKSASGKPAPRRSLVPAGNVDAEWTHDLHTLNNAAGSRAVQGPGRGGRGGRPGRQGPRFEASIASLNDQINIVSKPKPVVGIIIRGLAGPYTVIAENFAPGTTAADIESAMAPFGGSILKCVMTAAHPVTAEITFETKDGADNVISQFHNQTADGLLLSLYYKIAAGAPLPNAAPAAPIGPRADLMSSRPIVYPSSSRSSALDRYNPPRERSRDRRRIDDRSENMDVDERMDVDDRSNGRNGGGRGGLYSDRMFGRRGGSDDRRQDSRGYNREIGRGTR